MSYDLSYIQEMIDSRPVVTNSNMWMYLVVGNKYLKYEEVDKLVNGYLKNTKEPISVLCEKSETARNGVGKDPLLSRFSFNYPSFSGQQGEVDNDSSKLFKDVISNLYRLCGIGELKRSIEFDPKSRSIEEKFCATHAGTEHANVLRELFSDVLSRKELNKKNVKVYLASSSTEQVIIVDEEEKE